MVTEVLSYCEDFLAWKICFTRGRLERSDCPPPADVQSGISHMDLDRRTSSAILRSVPGLVCPGRLFLGSQPPKSRRLGWQPTHLDTSDRFPTTCEQTVPVAPDIS